MLTVIVLFYVIFHIPISHHAHIERTLLHVPAAVGRCVVGCSCCGSGVLVVSRQLDRQAGHLPIAGEVSGRAYRLVTIYAPFNHPLPVPNVD